MHKELLGQEDITILDIIKDVIAKEGYVDHTNSSDQNMMRINFCGMHALFDDGELVELKTHDMFIASNDNGDFYYITGVAATLALWSKRLGHFGPARLKAKSSHVSPPETNSIAA